MVPCPIVIVDVGPNLLALVGQALLVITGLLGAQRVQSAIVAGQNGKSNKNGNGNGASNALP